MATFALIFFVIIALAVLISVTNSFRDTEEDRFHSSNYGNPHYQYPDQHRYDDPDRHGNYGYNNPPIIIQTAPYDPYGGSRRRGGYQPRSSFPFGLLIIGAVAFFWFYSGDDKMKSSKGAEVVDTPQQEPITPSTDRTKVIDKQYQPSQPKTDNTPDADINGIEAPVANWFTLVARYNSRNPAREAMYVVSKVIDLQGKSVYYGPSPYGGWVVYIPAVSEIQALDFKQQILDHSDELDPYCPGKPKVISNQ